MTDEQAGKISVSRAWISLLVLLFLAIVSYMDRAIISLMIDPIRADLNASDVQISLIQGAAFAIFYALWGVPMGWLADTYSRRWVIYCGVTLWSLAAAGCGLSQSYGQLFIARIFVGVGEAALLPAGYSLIADIFPKRSLGRAVSIFSMGSLLGTAAALGLGGWLISVMNEAGVVHVPLIGSLKPWQFTFVATGIPGLLFAFLVFLIPPIGRAPVVSRSPASAVGFRAFLASRRSYLTLSILGFGCMSLVGVALLSWFPTYMMRQFEADVRQVGLVTGAIAGTVGVLGFLFSGYVVDHLFTRGFRDAQFRCGIAGALFMAICAAIGFSINNETAGFVTFGIIIFASSISGVAALSHLQIATPAQLRGRVTALFTMFFVLFGIGVGPTVVAVLTEHLFRDPSRVGSSLLTTFVVFGLLSAGFLALGLKHAATAVQQLESDR